MAGGEPTGLSLKCNSCGAQLRSAAEAQAHAEATGHADFAESEEAVSVAGRRLGVMLR